MFLFIPPSVFEYLVVPFWAAVNIYVQGSVWTYVFMSLGHRPRSRRPPFIGNTDENSDLLIYDEGRCSRVVCYSDNLVQRWALCGHTHHTNAHTIHIFSSYLFRWLNQGIPPDPLSSLEGLHPFYNDAKILISLLSPEMALNQLAVENDHPKGQPASSQALSREGGVHDVP